MNRTRVSRRTFLATAASGAVVQYAFAPSAAAESAPSGWQAAVLDIEEPDRVLVDPGGWYRLHGFGNALPCVSDDVYIDRVDGREDLGVVAQPMIVWNRFIADAGTLVPGTLVPVTGSPRISRYTAVGLHDSGHGSRGLRAATFKRHDNAAPVGSVVAIQDVVGA